tara:strand:- start:8301 stop:8573 length:273 start_codon:yes stop_codon:yes gene_type:complete
MNNLNQLEALKKRIEILEPKHHIEILKILSTHSCKLNENKSGVYINMTFFNDEIINDVNNYLQYINDQEERLKTVEYQKEIFKQDLDLNN